MGIIIFPNQIKGFSKNAITINEGDQLLEARLTSGKDEILLALKSGRAIRFNEKTVRSVGRNASGVRGIRLANAR